MSVSIPSLKAKPVMGAEYVKEMSVVITTGFGGDLAGVGVLTGTLTSSLRETEALIMSTTTYYQ